MKRAITKKISCVLMLLLINELMTTNAQEEIKPHSDIKTTWGIKAETNMSNFFISEKPVAISSKMKLGFAGGAFFNLEFNDHIALKGELMYYYKTSEFDRGNIKGKYRYWGMDIPVYAIYKWKLSENNSFYIGIGPYAEFGFSAEIKRDGEKIDLYEKGQISNSKISAMKDNDVGL